jgi:hypothetical protein
LDFAIAGLGDLEMRVFTQSNAPTLRFHLLTATISGMMMLVANAARADVIISSKPTRNMNCSAGVCIPTKAKARLNATDLANMLLASDIKVTADGAAKNIVLDEPLSWASVNRLTLDAYRSVVFNKVLTAAGTGALTLTTNDGGRGGTVGFTTTGSVVFWDLSSNLVIDGKIYMLFGDVGSLAADISANPSGFYALAKNYDASVDGSHSQSPVQTIFTGTLEGLGNAISNLQVNDTRTNVGVGLFSTIGAHSMGGGGTIADLRLIDVMISGSRSSNVGGIAAFSDYGAILSGDFVSGIVVSPDGFFAGGLVGQNNGSITNSSASTAVTGGYSAGGIVGSNQTNPITNTRWTGTVIGGDASYVGGIAGTNAGLLENDTATGKAKGGSEATVGGVVGTGEFSINEAILNCSADVSVSSTDGGPVGGLAGFNFGGPITGSHATGNVVSGDYAVAGGLAGSSTELISTSYATGSVKVGKFTDSGGLVGYNGGGIDQSFATGSVTTSGHSNDGRVAGRSTAPITNSYAEGAVSGHATTNRVGGLVGWAIITVRAGTIGSSYSTGQVSGGINSYTGGLVGADETDAGDLTDNYWDTTTSGINDPSQGAGNIPNDPGITGMTTERLQSGLPPGFDRSVWNEDAATNNGLPYLRDNPPP